VDERIVEAITARRLIAFSYDGRERIAEPHDLGIIGGEKRLFYYQVGGESRSGRPLGWRWAVVARMEAVRLLDQRFAGPRPGPSGRHHRWERLLASVSRPGDAVRDDRQAQPPRDQELTPTGQGER
jgi:hypothetical protein